MKIYDLLSCDKDAKVSHPIIGSVAWIDKKNGEGRMLVFADGQDKGKPLVCDDAVLFDDRWSLRGG